MLKYSKDQKLSLNLTLINSDGSVDDSATISYNIYNESNTIEVSGGEIIYNSQLESYIDIINPLIEWTDQTEGIYYIKWFISDTIEDYPDSVIEELYIESYNNKLDRILGLNHENIFIDNPIYDRFDNLQSARLRLYSDSASVSTNNNVTATYTISSDTFQVGKFNTWQQIKE